MAKRRASSSLDRRGPLLLGALALLALLVFIGGELFAFFHSDLGRVLVYRHLRLGDRAHVVRVLGKRIHEGLREAGVPSSAIHEDVRDATPALHWTVTLEHDGSPTRANYAIARALEAGGAVVLSGRETELPGSGQRVTLVTGLPGQPLHEIVLERAARVVPTKQQREADPEAQAEADAPSIAIVFFGLGDSLALDRRLMARKEPFALAAPAAGDGHEKTMRDARASSHELVLQVPMEPENYPRVNPGPGALLVNMSAGRIEDLTRGYLKDAGHPIAVANLMGSFATQDEPFMRAMYRALKKAGVTFLHIQPAPRSVCKALASREGVAYDEPDAILDAGRRGAPALAREWKAAIETIGPGRRAIVLVHVGPGVLEWLDDVASSDRPGAPRLVPLSKVIHRAGTL